MVRSAIYYSSTQHKRRNFFGNYTRLVLLILGVFCANISASAQPNDEQIRKDLTNTGVKKITFTKDVGTKQWNKDLGNWEYVRGVEVLRASQFPGVDVLVIGDVVYQQMTSSKFTYLKFRVLSNSYIGLKNPNQEELRTLIGKDIQKFYGYRFGSITAIIQPPTLAEDPEWSWESLKILDVRMTTTYELIVSATNIAKVTNTKKVRFFRDEKDAPWKSFIILNDDDPIELENKNIGEAAIRQRSSKTVEFTLAEQTSSMQAATLPSVSVPEFTTLEEAVKFVHSILRTGSPDEFRSVMMKLLAPQYFVKNSTTQLTDQGEEIIRDGIKKAYNETLPYKQLYCQNFPKSSLSGAGAVYIPSCIKNLASEIHGAFYTTGYKEGVEQKTLRIWRLEIRIRDDQDAVNFMNSFSNRSKLCPND